MKKSLFLFVLSVIFSLNLLGQLSVQNGLNGQELGEILAGDNIQVSNASISGNNLQYGSFTFSGTGLDVSSGVILSTGSIFDAVGPNNDNGTTTIFNGPGNALLTALANSQTYDATVLQFDFEVQSDEIEFNFIFLSEEYNEWVGTGFNDVFAFYISGPGISGEENLAVIPGTSVPVTINSINNNDFWQFYHDNTNGNTNIEFDGFTTMLKAQKSDLIPCSTYTLKLMIADAGDGMLDAGVLLQENSLIQPNISAAANTFSNNDIALEGCIEADFNFQLDQSVDYDVQIPITFAGTAINGVDYDYIDPYVVIPAGQTEGSIIIKSFSDGMTEGQESIELIYSPSVCAQPDTVELYIDDFQPIEFSATTSNANCNGADDGEVLFSIDGGFAPYLINLTDTITGLTTQYANNPIPNLNAGTYLVEIIDNYGCKAEDIVFGDIFNAGVTFLPTGTGVTYETSIDVTGFDDGEILETIDQFKQISATMEHSYANDLSITLRAPNGTEVLLKAEGDGYIGSNPNNSCDMGEPVSSDRVDDWNADNITPGVGYQYVWNNDPVYGTMTHEVDNQLLPEHTYISTYGNELTDYYYPSGSYEPEGNLSDFIGTELNGTWTIIVTDFYILDNGYIFEWSLSVSSPQSDSIITITEPTPPVITSTYTNPNCGSNNGVIDITVNNFTPTGYLWNTGETTQDLNNVSAGTYTVDITGDDGCVYDYSFNLSDNGTIDLTAITEAETCVGANNGEIDLTVNGGTPDFNYSWDNGAITEDITNLAPGDYTVSVLDASGCTGIETFTINPAVPILIEGTITNEDCGDKEGAIDITVTGGVEPYNFLWSNGLTTQNIDELQQGDYTVTVTDANNCTSDKTFTIINYVGNCIPDCDIEITNFVLTDETCGSANGSIDITVFTSFSPYTVSWSNGATTDDLSGLSANTYTVSIIDAEGCQTTQDYTINNETSGLEILSISATDETCGNGTGAIDLTVNGGALPYSYNWSNGATSEDLDNLSAGDYSVTITDANGCSVNDNITVFNDAGDLHQTWSYVVNETCGNSEGSIDILVDGGSTFGNGTYHYLWSNGATTKGIMNLSAGNYSCVITDANGCQISTPVYTVENEGGTLNIDWIDIDHETCSNGLGEIELTISGGTLPYTFSWNTGETSQDIFNLSAGTYNNIITDANGCSVSTGNVIIINESGTLSLDDISTTDELCNNNLGEIDLTITGGTTPYNYIWSTGSSSEDLSGLSSGNYSCVITDVDGCEVSVNTTINNDNGAIAVTNIITTDETCGNANGTIDLMISGAVAPITYNWNNGEITEDLTNLSAGSYNCLITDNAGCQTAANATIVNDAGTLSLDNAIVTNEQCGESNGEINIIVSGGTMPLEFNWDNGEFTEDLSNLSAGTYSCIITDADGCSIQAGHYTINNTSTAISVSDFIINDETCGAGNGEINITISGGSAPITYLWSNGATSEDLTNIAAGNYTITITDNSGCSIDETYTVNNNSGSLAISSFNTTNEICGNGLGAIDITVDGSSPISFSWNNGATTEDLSDITSGTYFVTISDNDGCEITSSDFIILNDPGSFELNSIDVDDEFCNNGTGSIDIDVQNGTEPITYNWSNGETTQDLNDLSQGTYTCIAVDANGCELNISATVYNQNGDLALSNTNITDETCGDFNGSIDITIEGSNMPFNYLWNNGSTTEDLTNIEGGNYSCIITDDAGCEIYVNATVEDLSGNFAIINSEITDEYCENQTGAINISVSGGQTPYNYNWSNGATTEDLFDLSAGTFDITITDNIGCETSSSYTIDNISSTLEISDVVITDEICGNGQGAIDITYSGANGNAYFNWSNGETTEDISSLLSGDFNVIITDDFGCSITETYFVDNVTGDLTVSDIIVTDETCGNDNGIIDITVSGGATPYIFNWSNGSTDEDLTNVDEGNYSCLITDANGCMFTISATVENITNGTTVDLVEIIDDECGSSIGSINITPTGGNAPYTFFWNNGSTNEDLTNVAAGNYYVIVTDNSNCEFTSETYTVSNVENDFEIVNIQTEPDFCGEGFGIIDFDVTPAGTYTYELDGVQQPLPFMDLEAGTYIVSAVDGNCRVDIEVTVESEGFFDYAIDNVQSEVCGQENGSIEISVFGGGPGGGAYTYLWNNGETTQDIFNLSAGNYSCLITHVNTGCEQSLNQTIENYTTFSASSEKTDATCGLDNGAIDVTLSPVGTYNFNWSNGASTEDLVNISGGVYICTISDIDGCEMTVYEEIINNENILDIQANIQNEICDQNNGSILLTIANAPLGYDILWNNNDMTNFIDNLSSGTYTATITDIEFGCEQTVSYTVIDEFTFTVDNAVTNASCETCTDGEIDLILSPADGNYSYAWSNGNDTEDIYNLLSGYYSVTISDDNGCTLDSIYFVDFDIVNIQSNDNYSIVVYPNPTEDFLNIDYDFSNKNNVQISILNDIGQELDKIELYNNYGRETINVTNLSGGIYFIKFSIDNETKIIKFIKK